jgi:hypothetical protein
MNYKELDFESQIDAANTVMRNLKLSSDIKNKINSYLQYTKIPLDSQREVTQFFKIISPSLQAEASTYIFYLSLNLNPVFKSDKEV